MSKIGEQGIIWIEDSEIYVAAKELFASKEEFLKNVISHISELVNSYSEDECGWCTVPQYESYISKVTTSWMVHRVASSRYDAPFWELVEQPGPGHTVVWYIDFESK